MGLVKSNGSLLPGLNVTCGLSALETRDQQRPLPFIQVYTAHNCKASDVLDLGLCTLLYFSFPEFTLGCDIVTLVILVSRAFLRPVYEDQDQSRDMALMSCEVGFRKSFLNFS